MGQRVCVLTKEDKLRDASIVQLVDRKVRVCVCVCVCVCSRAQTHAHHRRARTL